MADALPRETEDMRTKSLLAARQWLEAQPWVKRKLVPTGTKVATSFLVNYIFKPISVLVVISSSEYFIFIL